MARAIWSGAISFGLVNIPVKLYSATEQKDVSFHQLQKDSGERIRYKRVTDSSDDEVPYADVVKGYELDEGRYVVVSPDELESVEPGRSRTIDIEDFVDLDELDPVHFEKSYYLGPAGKEGAKPYELLRAALERSNKVAIARFVLRTKQYLAAVRSNGRVLVLETMFFPDEVREPDSVVGDLPSDVEVRDRELSMAEQLIDSLTTEWDPDRYRDTYRERVLQLIESKARGEDVVVEEEERPAEVVDLMEALRASLDSARGGGADGAERGDGRKRQRSRDELYQEAQRREIPGRSSMTKDELEHALDEAS